MNSDIAKANNILPLNLWMALLIIIWQVCSRLTNNGKFL